MKIIHLTLWVISCLSSIFLVYLWIPTTIYMVNKDEYIKDFSLPYGLEFAYHDYIYGGITICNNDEQIILSSDKKIGVKQVEVKHLLSYTVLPREKVIFKFLDGNKEVNYCSINKFHSVINEQNIDTYNWIELHDVLRWIRFKESLLSRHYEIFTCIILLILIVNIVMIRELLK